MLHFQTWEVSLFFIFQTVRYAFPRFLIGPLLQRPTIVHLLWLRLPLGLLAGREFLQDGHHLLQRREPGLQLLPYLRLVAAQLGVEVLPVRRGAHGGAEDRLDDEGVMRLEGVLVGAAEGVGELLGGVVDVGAEGLGGEVETTGK